MKRTLGLLSIILVSLTLSAQSAKPLSSRLHSILDRAVHNERQAAARYDAYALKAEEEGYRGAASLFRAAARAERVHAARFVAALEARGATAQAEAETPITVGNTAENLRAAASAEVGERDGFYRDAISDSSDAGEPVLAKMFDRTRDTEVEHANLMNNASRSLESMKEPRLYYVCDDCGYTTDVDLPLCALCRKSTQPHAVN